MAFYNSKQGNIDSLKHIANLIEEKSILIDGLTCAPGLYMNELGDKAYYYKRGESSLGYDVAGKPISYNNSGLVRVEFVLDHSIYINDVLPNAQYGSPEVDVVRDRMDYQAIQAANMHNIKGLEYIMINGTDVQDYDDLTQDNAFNKLIDLIEDFRLNNKDKGLEPTAVLVSNAAAKFLFKEERFAHYAQLASGKYTNEIARIGKIVVLECPDMDDDQDFDYICMNANALVAPLYVKYLDSKPGVQAGYPNGTLLGGELRVGFSMVDTGAVLIKKNKLALKKPVIHFDENFETISWAKVTGATGYIVDDNGTPGEAQEDRVADVTYTTSEKYIRVKAVSTDASHEESSEWSEKLFYQQRKAPELTIEDGTTVLTIEDPDSETGYGKYNIYVDSDMVEEEYDELEYDLAGLELEPGEHTIYAQSLEFDEESGKHWASSDSSDTITYTVPEPEEPEVEE